MPETFWSQVLLPAATLFATGIVGVILTTLKRKLEENTTVTVANKEALEANSSDQSRGFADLGKWRYEINERMGRMEEKFKNLEQRLSDADIHRLLALVQTQPAPASPPQPPPVVAPVVPQPSSVPQATPQVTVVEVVP